MGDLFDFRTEDLIRIRGGTETGGATSRVSLSELLARLSREEETELLAVQAHQQHAIHAFLVQLAAMHLDSSRAKSLPTTATEWEAALLALSDAEPSAWKLVVEDLSKPAFLQSPVPAGSESAFDDHDGFDDLDLTVASKNFDIKRQRLVQPEPDTVLVLLVVQQTMQGYSGPNRYGVARMNGGKGNRPGVALARRDSTAERFVHEASALAEMCPSLASNFGWNTGGIKLSWLRAFESMPLGSFHPATIEACRPVRIRGAGGALRLTSRPAPKQITEDSAGVLGDFWTPVSAEEAKSLTTTHAGFDYKLVHRLLLGAWSCPGITFSRRHDLLVLRALTRGDKTKGYHERVVPVPSRAFTRLLSDDARAALAGLSGRRIERIDTARMKVLKPALLVALQGAPDKLNFKDGRADAALSGFEKQMDEDYFEHLFTDVEEDAEVADERYERLLRTRLLACFLAAMPSLPIPDSRHTRATAVARNTLDGLLAKHLPLARDAASPPPNNPSSAEDRKPSFGAHL